MALEITGSRVLAVHFGSSIYVWGAIIAVFLAALSGGYYIGGMVADRKPSFVLLNVLIFVAGIWLLLIPLYANWVCVVILSRNLGERTGPLLATLILFGGPSVLLGMVSPFGVRLAAQSLENLGLVSGKLYALSTVGSIVGTLVSAFVLIPSVGVKSLLQVLGVCLIVLLPIVLPRSGRLVSSVFVVSVTGLLLIFNAYAPAQRRANRNVIYETSSAYHQILVVDDSTQNARFLQFNNYIESGIELSPPYETRVGYTDSFHLARIFKPDLRRVLIIGGGGGVAARKFVSDDPSVTVDLVEIDPKVADVTFKYFFLEESSRLKVYVEDGRRFVRSKSAYYDLVILDAFTVGGQIPFHLTTREFMQEVENALLPGGVVVANLNGSLESRRSEVVRSEYKTITTVFDSCYAFPRLLDAERSDGRLDPNRRRNIILVAVNGQGSWSREAVVSAAESLSASGVVKVKTFVEDARQFLMRPFLTDDVPLLTDDYAPVDTMAF